MKQGEEVDSLCDAKEDPPHQTSDSCVDSQPALSEGPSPSTPSEDRPIALALSGGGFRATLFHLGVIRYLLDIGKLNSNNVKCICSVSGGSVLAAHLVLKWGNYSNPASFKHQADRIIGITRADVRGRVLRKWLVLRSFPFIGFPLIIFMAQFAWPNYLPFLWQGATLSAMSLILGVVLAWKNPVWSRSYLLQTEYDHHLFRKDRAQKAVLRDFVIWNGLPLLGLLILICLSLLWLPDFVGIWAAVVLFILVWTVWCLTPRWSRRAIARLYSNKTANQLGNLQDSNRSRPDLYLMNTNITTGDLCAFSSAGFHWWQNDSHRDFPKDSLPVSFAVTASSAFPPVFPPLRIPKDLLPVETKDFPVEMYLTDGGVFDNLGFQGLEKVAATSDGMAYIISDAERKFDWNLQEEFELKFVIARAQRASDIVMHRVSNYQKSEIDSRSAILIRLQDQVDQAALTQREAQINVFAPDVQQWVANTRTDLDKFSLGEIQLLVYHGYRAAMQKYPQPGHEIGMELTEDRIPVVAQSHIDKRWLPFTRNEMSRITAESAARNSAQRNLWTLLKPGWLTPFAAVLLLCLFAMAVYFYRQHLSFPRTLQFQEVFGNYGTNDLQKQVLNEIDSEPILYQYKFSLFPKKPANEDGKNEAELPSYIFFGITKPLGTYTSGIPTRSFQCVVKPRKENHTLEVRLVLVSKNGKETVYTLLPPVGHDGAAHVFSVPSSAPENSILAIGRIDQNNGETIDRRKLTEYVQLEARSP